MSEASAIAIREISPAETSELALIFSSWKRSFREACSGLRTDSYYVLQGAICDDILARFPLLLVARNEHGSVLGWVCAEGTENYTVVHYIYCKQYCRRNGVAKRLLSAALASLDALEAQGVQSGQALIYTHKTRHAPIAERYGFKHVEAARFLREAA